MTRLIDYKIEMTRLTFLRKIFKMRLLKLTFILSTLFALFSCHDSNEPAKIIKPNKSVSAHSYNKLNSKSLEIKNLKDKNNIRDNLLVYCSEASPQSFNPQLVTSGTTFDASSKPIYNRLVDFKRGTSQVEASLATHWDVSADGKEYTFYLRKNVAFHHTKYFQPSRNFNADDVLFSIFRQKNQDHPFHAVSNLGYRYFRSMEFDSLITKLEKLDDHTIKFTLDHPESPFIATLAMDFASILSAEYANNLQQIGKKSQMDHLPIGTGPFQFEKYNPDAFIRYRAHPNYWQGEERLKELVYAITPDPSLRFARLIAGECDVMAKPLPIHIKSIKQYPEIISYSESGSNIAYLSMNTRKKPFDNPNVRKAINLAINKKRLLKIVYDSSAIEAKNPIPPNMWSFNDYIPAMEYDPKEAKQLLHKEGFTNGFKMDLWAMNVQRTYNPNARKMAELIQKDLEKIGVKVSIISYEFGTFLEKTKRGEHHAALLGWIGDNGDPDNFFSSLLGCAATLTGGNASFWCNPAFDKLINQARRISVQEHRSELYEKAQVIFNQELPWVPIAHAQQFVLANKRVINFRLAPTDGIHFNDVYLLPTKH
ncbi:MAG: ABC transporter substrate-binding protein [Kangiella sp.]|nr:MAG: ABC transporter substrate-binding protein [Kangiella sp.]